MTIGLANMVSRLLTLLLFCLGAAACTGAAEVATGAEQPATTTTIYGRVETDEGSFTIDDAKAMFQSHTDALVRQMRDTYATGTADRVLYDEALATMDLTLLEGSREDLENQYFACASENDEFTAELFEFELELDTRFVEERSVGDDAWMLAIEYMLHRAFEAETTTEVLAATFFVSEDGVGRQTPQTIAPLLCFDRLPRSAAGQDAQVRGREALGLEPALSCESIVASDEMPSDEVACYYDAAPSNIVVIDETPCSRRKKIESTYDIVSVDGSGRWVGLEGHGWELFAIDQALNSHSGSDDCLYVAGR